MRQERSGGDTILRRVELEGLQRAAGSSDQEQPLGEEEDEDEGEEEEERGEDGQSAGAPARRGGGSSSSRTALKRAAKLGAKQRSLRVDTRTLLHLERKLRTTQLTAAELGATNLELRLRAELLENTQAYSRLFDLLLQRVAGLCAELGRSGGGGSGGGSSHSSPSDSSGSSGLAGITATVSDIAGGGGSGDGNGAGSSNGGSHTGAAAPNGTGDARGCARASAGAGTVPAAAVRDSAGNCEFLALHCNEQQQGQQQQQAGWLLAGELGETVPHFLHINRALVERAHSCTVAEVNAQRVAIIRSLATLVPRARHTLMPDASAGLRQLMHAAEEQLLQETRRMVSYLFAFKFCYPLEYEQADCKDLITGERIPAELPLDFWEGPVEAMRLSDAQLLVLSASYRLLRERRTQLAQQRGAEVAAACSRLACLETSEEAARVIRDYERDNHLIGVGHLIQSLMVMEPLQLAAQHVAAFPISPNYSAMAPLFDRLWEQRLEASETRIQAEQQQGGQQQQPANVAARRVAQHATRLQRAERVASVHSEALQLLAACTRPKQHSLARAAAA